MIVDAKMSAVVGSIFDVQLDLQIGDEILSWNGNLWDPEVEGDLGDVLRGYDGDRVRLSLLRDGSELLVEVPIKAGRSYHNREWVFFTGLLITEDEKTDAAFGMGDTDAPVLLIESVDINFDDSVDIEFDEGSEVLRVDSLKGIGLRALYTYLEALPKETEVQVVARVYDWSPEAYSSLMRHTFKVEKLGCSWCGE